MAHIGFFRDAYVGRLKWLSEKRFGELMALTQFLPGPGSSQLGAAIGYERGGWMGGLGAWLGFTLPSAIVMILFAVGMGSFQEWLGDGWLHGLKLAAVAVVAVALMGMRKGLCPRLPEMLLALVALLILFFFKQIWVPPVIILLGGFAGVLLFGQSVADEREESVISQGGHKRSPWLRCVLPAAAIMILFIFVPSLFPESNDAKGVSGLLQSGALVFGGGHVVLPLLESSTVDTGLLDGDTFLVGYGAAQVVPGPLFTFGGFLGAAMNLFGNAWLGGAIGIGALFLPGMVLLAGALPVWDKLKNFSWARAGVRGANATVVGVLGAALLGMLLSGAVSGVVDGFTIVILILAIYFKWLPVWAIVIISAVVSGWVA